MIGKSKSVGVLNFQKTIKNSGQTYSKNDFIPFVSQRKLGKLIVQDQRSKQQKQSKYSINDINFKNFKQIYNKQHLIELARYSRMTRNSQQQDLISHRPDWKLNQIDIKKKRSRSQLHLRDCCSTTKVQQKRSRQQFNKMDQDVYKKIAVSRPNQHLKNPQINTLFRHYVEVCELNQNLRRTEMIRKQKF